MKNSRPSKFQKGPWKRPEKIDGRDSFLAHNLRKVTCPLDFGAAVEREGKVGMLSYSIGRALWFTEGRLPSLCYTTYFPKS